MTYWEEFIKSLPGNNWKKGNLKNLDKFFEISSRLKLAFDQLVSKTGIFPIYSDK